MEKTTQESQNVPVIVISFTSTLDGIMDLLKQMSDGEVCIIPEELEKSGSGDPYKFSTALADMLVGRLKLKKEEINPKLIIYVADWIHHPLNKPETVLYYSWMIDINEMNKTWSKSANTMPIDKDRMPSEKIIRVSFT